MASEVRVELGERSYRVILQELDRWPEISLPELADLGRNGLLVTDRRVGPLWAGRVCESLQGMGLHLESIELPVGEASKCLDILQTLYDRLLALGLKRDSCVVALGGGVVGDLAGFAASTYLRGISLLQIPTSLLAMADSSVGGKVGIDYGGAKNVVGAFHQPCLVLTSPSFLTTLDNEEFANGLAEVIKAAVIADPILFELLETEAEAIWNRDRSILERILTRSIEVKAKIVAEDEREAGVRQFLNLGHTLGHAIEAWSRFEGIRHGEAVAIGLVAACQLSIVQGITTTGLRDRVERLLEKHRLPTRLHGGSWDEIGPWLRYDKKGTEGGRTFVLTKDIGDVSVQRQVPETSIRQAALYVFG